MFAQKIVFISIFFFLCLSQIYGMEGKIMTDNIYWLGHDGFEIIHKDKVIYIDPFKIPDNLKKADVILLTHPHFDHASFEDVQKLLKSGTIVVGTEDTVSSMSGKKRVVKVGDKISFSDIEVLVVSAYNVDKKFHPKKNGWVGYIINISGKQIYHAGDTDYIPEMKNYKADIALLPVSGTYVMTADEAYKAAIDINPKIVIPMHYGSIVGTKQDAERLKELLEGKIEVDVKQKGGL